LHGEIRTFISQQAAPFFAKAATPREFAAMLRGLLTSAGLEIQHLTLVKHECEPAGERLHSGSTSPTPAAEHRDFTERVRVGEQISGGWTDRFYWLKVEGKDPDCIIGLFASLFQEAFEQAAKNWFSAKL
jgi:hypothetical protein